MDKVGKIFRDSLIDNIKDGVENNKGIFLLSYSAVSSSEMDGLRKNLKKIGAQLYVSKNRIAQIALKEIDLEQLAEKIERQTAFAWSNEDAVEVSKALVNFTKKRENVEVKGGFLDGSFLDCNDVRRLADLPSKEVLRAQLLGTIIAPLTRLASVLNGKSRDLLSILKQLSEKKGGN